jgi:pimeloyl-ACP methyl ester carboxylesterase
MPLDGKDGQERKPRRKPAKRCLPLCVWGQENPAFRQLFTSQFLPDGTKEQADWFNELQRISTSPEDAARNLMATGETDVTALLSKVNVPTLVMHSRHDARVPFEAGRRMAAGIQGARFVPLESRNHLILEDEPAFGRFLHELKFLKPDVSKGE